MRGRWRVPQLSALFAAGTAAALYAVLAGTYIVVSSRIAASAAEGAEQLHRFEVWKGLAFVVVTALGLFGAVWAAVRRVVRAVEAAEKSRAAFIAAERRATAAQLTAAVAHDFNNLLQVVEGVIDALPEARSSEEVRELTGDLDIAGRRARELTERLFRVARGEDGEGARRVDVVKITRDTLGLLMERVLRHRRPSLSAPDHLEAVVRPTVLRQILVNLVLNARDATDGRGQIEVAVTRSGGRVQIAVEDDGPGVPASERARIFDAFHTTKAQGTGLGLVSVKACAEQHGGQVRVTSSRLGGARFEVELAELPGAQEDAPEEEGSAALRPE
jgi:signal transduction histidine kinase